jgi:methionyl-tRNA formyltransferase
MRLVMMGTGPFAVPTFEALLDSRHQVVTLYTRPSPPFRGRGPAPVNPMRMAAERRGVPVLDPANINDESTQQELAALSADLLVVCDYGQILKASTLATARLGGINLHGSLLPRYRGAAPVQWAVYAGDPRTGVSVIHMTPLLDGGPVIAVRETEIDENETAGELESRLSRLGVPSVFQALELLESWDGQTPLGALQDPSLACKAPRITKQDGSINWARSAVQIRNQIRAFQPWPGSYTHWKSPKGEWIRIIVDRVTLTPDSASQAASEPSVSSGANPAEIDREPGQVVVSDGRQLRIFTGNGELSIDRLQPAGKRVMEVGEFLRGYPVRVGDRFENPPAA